MLRRAHAVELHRDADQLEFLVVGLLQDAERQGLRMDHDLVHGLGRRVRHADGIQLLRPVDARLGLEHRFHHRVERAEMLPAARVRGEARVVRPFGMAERLAHLAEQPVVGAGDDEIAVGAFIGLVGRDAGRLRADALRVLAGAVVAGRVIVHPAECGLVERGVDAAALAGLVAVVQRGEHAHGAPHAGAHVDDRGADARRRAAFLAVDAHDAAAGLHQRVVAGPLLVGAGVAEGAAVAIDQPRVLGHQVVGGQAELLDQPGAQVLQHHVGLLDDVAAQPVELRFIREINDHGLLVRVQSAGRRSGRRP